MPYITFIDFRGISRTVRAEMGASLMEAARSNDIRGIDAECGGVCACATCHVYIDEAFVERLNPLTEAERPMLEFIEASRPNSRLACQVRITQALDGMKVRTPESQR